MNTGELCKHLIICGRVQGVGYRAWAAATARRLGLRGWARNLTDGSVEAVISGSPDVLEKMIAHCHKGPLVAKVTRVSAQDYPLGQLPEPFATLPTAEAKSA